MLARIIRSGSLEQIIHRVNALHQLSERGVRVVKPHVRTSIGLLGMLRVNGRGSMAWRPRELGVPHRRADPGTVYYPLADGAALTEATSGRSCGGVAAILGAIERRTSGWRTNVSRGGEPAGAPSRPSIAGVDLLTGRDGKTYVLEVNGIPGWEGLQRATGLDVAGAIVEHAVKHALPRKRFAP